MIIIFCVCNPCYNETSSHCTEQSRDLGDHTVANGQNRIFLHGCTCIHATLEYPDGQPSQQIDNDDNDTGDGIMTQEKKNASENDFLSQNATFSLLHSVVPFR